MTEPTGAGLDLAPEGDLNPFRRPPTGSRPWIIAHRGDSYFAPENTLEAARRAWEAGADAWELDVQLSRDGVPFVLHDPSLLRTTDVARRFVDDPRAVISYPIAEFDLDEIRSLDAGSWFVDPAGGHRTAAAFGTLDRLDDESRRHYASGRVRIPTLAEALELTAELGWRVNIELKASTADHAGFLDVVLALISPAIAGRTLISSFHHDDVAQVARLRPSVATGVLTTNPLSRPHAYVREWVGADAYHPSAGALGAESVTYLRSRSPDALRTVDLDDLGRAGVPIHVYTVNDAAPGGLADHLAEVGVSGVFTDDPGSLAVRWGRCRSAGRS